MNFGMGRAAARCEIPQPNDSLQGMAFSNAMPLAEAVPTQALFADQFVRASILDTEQVRQKIHDIAHDYKTHTVFALPVLFARGVSEERFAGLLHELKHYRFVAYDWDRIVEPLALNIPAAFFTSTSKYLQNMLAGKFADVRTQTRLRRQLGALLTWSRALIDQATREHSNPVFAGLAGATDTLLEQAEARLCDTRQGGWVTSARQQLHSLLRALRQTQISHQRIHPSMG